MPSVHREASFPTLSCAGEDRLFILFTGQKGTLRLFKNVHYGVVPTVSWITTFSLFSYEITQHHLPFATVIAHSILSEDKEHSTVVEIHYLPRNQFMILLFGIILASGMNIEHKKYRVLRT